MNEYRIKVEKLIKTGAFMDYVNVPLSIVEEEQLNRLLLNFFDADFKDRDRD